MVGREHPEEIRIASRRVSLIISRQHGRLAV
jgi:hypothetical protein